MVPVRLGRHRRVLITGGSGVVASAMVRATPGDAALTVTRRRRAVGVPVGAEVSVRTVELTDPIAVDRLLAEVRPDVVVHAAASISDAADVVTASDVVAHGAARHGAELVHLSSDAVFAGDAAPYAEGDRPDPVHDYGRWKAEAEQLARAAVPDVCITRTSLVVSVDPPDRTVERVLDGARRAAAGEQQLPRWFHDELRCPIRASDLADQLWALVELPRSARAGVWHLPGPEVLSRLEIARRICVSAGVDPELMASASVHDHSAPRPADLTLSGVRAPLLGVRTGPVP